MSNLSELLPAGAGAKSADFVASGTLGSGVTVALKADGTVTAVASDAGGQQTGTPVVFEDANINNLSSVFDSSNNKIVIGYRDLGNSSYGTAVVGTVSGTSISFGSPVVFNTGNTAAGSAAFDSSANKVVFSWSDVDNGFYGTSIVGTVSGTSISFGSPVIFKSVFVLPATTSSTFDSNLNKVVIAYRYVSNAGEAVVGTVSGTGISFGTPVAFIANDVGNTLTATFDSNSNKVVIGFQDLGNSNAGTAVVGTVSGTSISFGSLVVFNASGTVTSNTSAFDSNSNKVIFVYMDEGNSYDGTAIVGTVSGTSISFGSESVFTVHPGNANLYLAAAFDTTSNKLIITYLDFNNSGYATAVAATISGTSISFGTPLVYEQSGVSYNTAVFDSVANNVVISYMKASGTSSVYTFSGSNSADFIGITDQAIADTATGAVIVQGGVSEKASGLTVGADYYVQADGSISSPTAPAPYNLSGASYDSVSFSVNSQEPAPNAVVFNPTGTKMFVVGQTNNTVYEYALATGFDVSTASYTQSFSVSAQSAYSVGLAFNLDGTKMFVADYTNSNVYEYALSTGFNVSTASYTQTLSVSTQSSGPSGLVFNLDGTKMFITAFTGQDVNEYSLSTAFDISTATYAQNFSTASQETEPQETVFSSNGKKMFVVGSNTSTIYEYSLSTGYDISTASYSSISFSVSSQEAQSRGLAFNSSGNKFFMCGGFSGGAVYQYSTGVGSATTVPAGRALSSTSILLEG